MIILDLEKIKQLDKKYQDSEIAYNAFHNMISIFLSDEPLKNPVAYNTLKDLKVIKEKQDSTQQLNS
jgi:hypothetical protein